MTVVMNIMGTTSFLHRQYVRIHLHLSVLSLIILPPSHCIPSYLLTSILLSFSLSLPPFLPPSLSSSPPFTLHLLQWKVMKLHRTTQLDVLTTTGYQPYPFSSLSVSDEKCVYIYIYVLYTYVIGAILNIVHTCCPLHSVVYSVEITVKILALGPRSFFTKAWNV